jgi:hypothetical protein
MADNVTILDANDVEVPVAADDVSSVWYQYVKLDLGAGGASAPAVGTVPISDGAGSLTVDNGGTFAVQAAPAEHAKTMKHARIALSAGQTGATVLDPTNGTKFVLHKMILSVTASGTVEFFDETDSGATVIGPILNLAAYGGWTETWDMQAPLRSAAVNNVLKYTSSATFTGSLYIEYWEE